jgi:hypothetical protein
VKSDIDFVISHPNGWGGFQQAQLRQALVKAGLVEANEEPGNSRVSFITEGEASLHFALRHGLPPAVSEVRYRLMTKDESRELNITAQNGEGVIIVDGGGGTIDISTYRKPKLKSNYEEIAVSECETAHFFESINVSSLVQVTSSVLSSSRSMHKSS